ncbi:F-box protein [Quillaja saponaria]|uniref:F-box protein n=1 Tax=Quillaja saponaria TaxID=32244 RepID=A0AAD7QGQ9_QUISA|nr:F-box protein [Quillaja saponaria]
MVAQTSRSVYSQHPVFFSMGSRTTTGKWSDLPKDLLALIAKHLNSRTDILRLRGVCSSWRSSICLSNYSSTPCFPIKVPVPNCFDPDLRTSCCCLLTETILYFIEAPNKLPKTSKSNSIKKFSWLIWVEHSEEPGKLHYKDTMVPSVFENPRIVIPKFLNLLEYRVSEISRFYDLKLDGGKLKSFPALLIKKVVVSSNTDNFSVMALHHCSKLGLWKMGDKSWTEIENGRVKSKYIDIAYQKGKFFAVGVTGQTILVDCSSLHPITVISVAPPEIRSVFQCYDDRSRYLVNSVGNLLLISNAGESDNRLHFNVHKLDEENHIWVSVDSLGDQVLLLDSNLSVSVSAQDLIGFGCKKNCIYFSFYGYTKYSAYPGYNAWLFDLEDYSVKLVKGVPDKPQFLLSPPTWFRRSKVKKKNLSASLKYLNFL